MTRMKSGFLSASPAVKFLLVSDRNFEGATIVTVIVVIDGEKQTAIGRCTYRHLAADEKRLTHLAACRSNVANQRSGTGSSNWSGADNGTKAPYTAAFWSNLAEPAARDDFPGCCDRNLVAHAHIDCGVRTA